MTGTDLCVNKPHCAAAVRPWESEATTSTFPPARVRTCTQFWDILFSAKVSSNAISLYRLFSLKDECDLNVEIIKAAGIQYINSTV